MDDASKMIVFKHTHSCYSVPGAILSNLFILRISSVDEDYFARADMTDTLSQRVGLRDGGRSEAWAAMKN